MQGLRGIHSSSTALSMICFKSCISKLPLFKKVKAISKVQSSPYYYVKTWFEHQFPNYTEQVVFGEDGTITFVKREKNAAAEVPTEKPATEERGEAPAVVEAADKKVA